MIRYIIISSYLCPNSPSIHSRWTHRANCHPTVAGGHRLHCIWCPRTHNPLEQRWREASQRGTGLQHLAHWWASQWFTRHSKVHILFGTKSPPKIQKSRAKCANLTLCNYSDTNFNKVYAQVVGSLICHYRERSSIIRCYLWQVLWSLFIWCAMICEQVQ